MTQLSEHFNRTEFACKCGCGQDTVDTELIPILEKIRVHFDVAVSISSGNRCQVYNDRVGGASKSQHLISRAADIVVKGVGAGDVFDWINSWHTGGLGRYQTFTHVDSRKQRTRWNG